VQSERAKPGGKAALGRISHGRKLGWELGSRRAQGKRAGAPAPHKPPLYTSPFHTRQQTACYNFASCLPCSLTEDGIDKRFIRTNDRIRAREIRVIDDEGAQIGILPPFEALKMAREKNLDLVEISPSAVPPVCRIMDYGKFLYQQEKKEREAKKHQKTITVKEVKFRINVDDHDYETKKNHVLRFLDEGDKVKATIFFRGREMTRTGLGRQILERLIRDVEDKSIVEFRPRQEGNTLHAILAPKKDATTQKSPTAAPQPKRASQA
jgi:translation initiation factor IF-3